MQTAYFKWLEPFHLVRIKNGEEAQVIAEEPARSYCPKENHQRKEEEPVSSPKESIETVFFGRCFTSQERKSEKEAWKEAKATIMDQSS